MWADMVIFFDPAIDCGLGLFCGLEPVCIEDFVAQRAVKAFIISVLPGAAWIDVNGLNADAFEPCLEHFGDKFGAVIRTNKLRLSVLNNQRVKRLEYLG